MINGRLWLTQPAGDLTTDREETIGHTHLAPLLEPIQLLPHRTCHGPRLRFTSQASQFLHEPVCVLVLDVQTHDLAFLPW